MAQMADDSGLKRPGFNPQPTEEKYFLLVLVGYFRAYEIHLLLFAALLKIHAILNNHEKDVARFSKSIMNSHNHSPNQETS